MLSQEQNELLTRVGPGTPMGELMRRYWVPVVFSWGTQSVGVTSSCRKRIIRIYWVQQGDHMTWS